MALSVLRFSTNIYNLAQTKEMVHLINFVVTLLIVDKQLSCRVFSIRTGSEKFGLLAHVALSAAADPVAAPHPWISIALSFLTVVVSVLTVALSVVTVALSVVTVALSVVTVALSVVTDL